MKNFKKFFAGVIGILEFLWYSRKELFYGLRFILAFFWISFAVIFAISFFGLSSYRGEVVEMGLSALKNHPIVSVLSILTWIIPMTYSYARENLSQHHNAVKI